MSAISRFDDYAYNLHTGVDRRYRGRKLAQAVKVLALRYARFSCATHRAYAHAASQGTKVRFRQYFDDFGDDVEQGERIKAALPYSISTWDRNVSQLVW